MNKLLKPMCNLPKPMPSWIGLQKCSEVSLTTKVRLPKNFFYNSLKQNPVLVGKQFDSVFRNVVGSTRDSQEEYDILLFNGDSVFIIEVKYRVHPKDIDTLIKRKGGNFLLLLPQDRDFQRHLRLATFSIEDAVLQEALDHGITILQRRGDLIETIPAAA